MPSPLRSVWVAALATLSLSCGPRMRRDLTAVPQRQITYDDMCGLQAHFDQRRAAGAAAYRAVNEQSNETSETEPDEFGRMRRVMVGEGTYLVQDRSDRRRLAQLLREEFTRLPPLRLGRAETTVSLQLSWWQSGTVRRTRPDEEAVLTVDGVRHTLPPHPCLGEFLFGDTPYTMRHNVLAAEQDRARGALPQAYLADASSDASSDASTDVGSDVGSDAGPREVLPDAAPVR